MHYSDLVTVHARLTYRLTSFLLEISPPGTASSGWTHSAPNVTQPSSSRSPSGSCTGWVRVWICEH